MTQRNDKSGSHGLTRRRLLLGAAGLPAVAGLLSGTLGLPRALAQTRGSTSASPTFGPLPEGFGRLRAASARAALLADSMPSTPVWAYEGATPGPEIRVTAGERVRMRLENALEQETTIHWHGIRIANAMDGASGFTQEPVQPGETFDYDFVAPDPGTYWYHSHDRSWEQNARGLHGPLIVEEREPYPVDREVTLVIDDWLLGEDGRIHEESFGSPMHWSHAGRVGNRLTVNGRAKSTLDVRAGERIRFRVINTANARLMGIGFADLPAKLIALDGHPITPRPVDRLEVIAPAQRADIVVDMTGAPGSTGEAQVWTQDGPIAGATLRYGSLAPLRRTFDDVSPLPNLMRHAALDLKDTVRAELRMEGGAMGTMSGAMMGGRRMGLRELMGRQRFWAFNGVAGDMDLPLVSFERGQTAVLTVRNDTSWPHAMHLHGHHFRVLSRDGSPASREDWRDTELMAPRETVEIAFVADNPGKWLLHCHMLEHQAGGMITWFEVV